MEEMRCDVVVIGSGIGGMCAAAKLAHAGLQVIVLEKLPILGGRYTSVEYDGCIVHPASVVLIWGEGSPVWHTLQEVDAPKFETKVISHCRFQFKGKSLDMRMDSMGDFRPVISLASRNDEETDRVLGALKTAFLWREPSDTITFKEWLRQYTDNETIHVLFNCFATSWGGINIHEYPAGEFIRVMKCTATRGKPPIIAKNGLKDVIDSLEQVIKRHKGKVLTECEVSGITVKGGVVKGVVAQKDGKNIEVEAKVVVSNAGPERTIELAGRENFEKSYLKEVRDKIRTPGGVVVEFATTKPLLDFAGWIMVVDPEMRVLLWCLMGSYWEHWKPKGRHPLIGWLVPENTLSYDPRKEYETLIQDAKKFFPNWEECEPEVMRLKNFCGNWPPMRSWQGYQLGQRTSIENLWCVGDANCPPGFVAGEGAAESGRMAAEQIKATAV